MRLIIAKDYADVSRKAANIIAARANYNAKVGKELGVLNMLGFNFRIGMPGKTADLPRVEI